MKNKMKMYLSACAFMLMSSGCFGLGPQKTTIGFTVKDEDSFFVKDAHINALYYPFGEDSYFIDGMTNEDGFLELSGKTHYDVKATVKKEGFYESQKKNLTYNAGMLATRPPIVDEKVTFILRKQLNPTALKVKRFPERFPIPVENEWIGFDFEVGDWVSPHGKGKTTDFLLRYDKEFLEMRASDETIARVREMKKSHGEEYTDEQARYRYGIWKTTYEITFPNEDEGLIEVFSENGYLSQSEMKLPHLAPETGYEPKKVWKDHITAKFQPNPADGYFFRTRVVKDDAGNIISANYAKMNADFDFQTQGEVGFTYYYNPEANNRNLEWDRKNNLFKDLDRNNKPIPVGNPLP